VSKVCSPAHGLALKYPLGPASERRRSSAIIIALVAMSETSPNRACLTGPHSFNLAQMVGAVNFLASAALKTFLNTISPPSNYYQQSHRCFLPLIFKDSSHYSFIYQDVQ